MPKDDFATPSEFSRIDAACDRFGNELRSGNEPQIENYLDGSTEPDRRNLFRALIEIAFEITTTTLNPHDASEFTRRFPDYAAAIDEVQSAASVANETIIHSEDHSAGETAIWPLPDEPQAEVAVAGESADNWPKTV